MLLKSTSWVALAGMAVLIGCAWLLSEARRDIQWRGVGSALLLQFLLGLALLRLPPVRAALLWLSTGITALKQATLAGTSFVFGYAGGGPTPFVSQTSGNNFIFGLQALPIIMVVSSLSMLLFHWRVLPLVVHIMAQMLSRTLRIGGALGVCAAAKVFLGQTEAPLLIRPYLAKLSRSELFCVMSLGMATTSAAVMVIYASILEGVVQAPMQHILTASCMSVPAAILFARVMVPSRAPPTAGTQISPYAFRGAADAVAFGATEGMKLYLNIIAMLIVSLALVSLVNQGLGLLTLADAPLSLQRLAGVALAPLAYLLGIPWSEASTAGHLLGTKLALNEVIAFVELAKTPPSLLSAPSRLILTYALCGFANLASIGIQIGGIGTMVPERRSEIIALGWRSMLAGALSTCLSGSIAGLISS